MSGGGNRSRVAVALLLVFLLPLLATPPPRVEARELLGGDHASEVEASGHWTMFRGLPALGGAGRRTTSVVGNAVAVAARVLGSVPSPGVGH